jgi:hypothetical protein
MTAIRRYRTWVAAGWLLARVAAFAAAPLAFAVHPAPAGAQVVTCDCPDAVPGRACPMHSSPRLGSRGATDTGDPRKSGDPGGRGDNNERCRMRGSCSPSDIAFLALAGSIGIPVAAGALAVPETAATFISPRVKLLAWAERPDAPPPRS